MKNKRIKGTIGLVSRKKYCSLLERYNIKVGEYDMKVGEYDILKRLSKKYIKEVKNKNNEIEKLNKIIETLKQENSKMKNSLFLVSKIPEKDDEELLNFEDDKFSIKFPINGNRVALNFCQWGGCEYNHISFPSKRRALEYAYIHSALGEKAESWGVCPNCRKEYDDYCY